MTNKTRKPWRWPTETSPGEGSLRHRSWTAEDVRLMRTLAQEGRTMAEIAKAVGRSEAATQYKARMYGVRLQLVTSNHSSEGRHTAVTAASLV